MKFQAVAASVLLVCMAFVCGCAIPPLGASAIAAASAPAPPPRAIPRIDESFPLRRYAHCVVAVGPRIYVLGGIASEDQSWAARVDVLDTRTGEWAPAAPMPTPRAFAGAAVCNGRIYVIGGISEQDQRADRYSAVVECYDHQADRWSPAPALRTPRSRLAAASLDGRVYALGGLTGSDHGAHGPCTDSDMVEELEPGARDWKLLPPLRTARHALCAVAVGDRLWALGGYALKRRLSQTPAVESMSPRWNTWRPEAPMASPRAWFGAAGVGDQIVTIGNGGAPGSPEVLNCRRRAWSMLDAPDRADRRFAVAAVDGLVYVLGGELDTDQFVHVFDPAARSWIGGPE